MERKQNNLVSIGEAFGGLDRPVKAIQESSPQARRHFTRFDQMDQLAWARGAARVEENQARLAGVELLDRSGRPDPAPFNPDHRAAQSSPATKLISPFPALRGPSAAFPRRVGL